MCAFHSVEDVLLYTNDEAYNFVFFAETNPYKRAGSSSLQEIYTVIIIIADLSSSGTKRAGSSSLQEIYTVIKITGLSSSSGTNPGFRMTIFFSSIRP